MGCVITVSPMETVYLTHETAWWYWQNAKNAATTLDISPTRAKLLRAAGNCAQVREVVRGTSLAGMALSVAFPKRGRRNGKNITFRSVPEQLPAGSFVQLKRGIYLASPELSFVQAAAEMPFAQAVRYGCALCGTFVLDPASKFGVAHRKALTTLEKLEQFVDACRGMRGARQARAVLRYVCEGSASPRESDVLILLTLPLCRGGYGIPQPLLNYEIALPSHLRRLTQRNTLRVDFFWPRARLAGEYDSDAAHAESADRCSDETKRIALASLGFENFGFTTLQVDRCNLMDATVAELRKRLGLRPPARLPKNYAQKKRDLRCSLGLVG